MNEFDVRAIHADEWPAMRELRLAALQDPAAPLAFFETYDSAVKLPDSFWQERAEGCAEGAAGARQFVAVGADGVWVGGLAVLVEEAGGVDWAGLPVEQRQGQVVGVYVRPAVRGGGVVVGALFRAALEWAWGIGLDRVRLLVHRENVRAVAAYERIGFVPTGVVVPIEGHGGEDELEFVYLRPSGR
ncbi:MULTISPECIES: GNAT family N-acetyltransferase [unclassified Streptomyces]|uniref:GNAT family N-acetyltransferase n=1 Tax=unclassified Streptomyces TaxID=2593676 RepID=UPI000DD911CB|nr:MULTISPECIES: GNAT family N-acetyltransferase [unclassified Streptomyces]QZZ28711.1 GNAT family N-acetyltransferase [Streptomyces sp. ST1015]